ncbi:MAG: transposase [Candidatus Helarchaeota archaeon]
MYYGESTFQAFLSETLTRGAALYYNTQKLKYIQKSDFHYYPNEYGGSYYMLFSSHDFYFSVLENTNKKSGPGHPKFDRNALFRCLMLKTLMMPNSYRSLITKLRFDNDLAKIIGLNSDRIPNTSILKKFLHELDIETLYQINLQLINEQRSSGVLNFNKLAVDSVPIESFFRPPTKKEESSTDPDATWGFSKCKGGWYLGYKAHIITDIDSKLGISCIVTRAIESDQKITDSLTNLLKKLEIQPKLLLADAGYDSEDNHFKLREELNCVGIIKPNPRRKKGKDILQKV